MPDAASPTFRALFDVIPSPCLIVDPDVRILDLNAAAVDLLGNGKDAVFRRRGGEAMKCLHAFESPDGCGHAELCRECVIRNAVTEAVRGGKPHRRNARAEIVRPAGPAEINLLVTAAPFGGGEEPRVLLILEDVSELIRLRDILPICAWCKKIRNDDDYWESVEDYFRSRADVDFSHGICNECLAKLSSGK